MKNLKGVMTTESLTNLMIRIDKEEFGQNHELTNEELSLLLSNNKIIQLLSKREELEKKFERLTNKTKELEKKVERLTNIN